MKDKLTIKLLCAEAKVFAENESTHEEASIFGVTDGKAVGTYLEHKFQAYLRKQYTYVEGSSAKGIDFPELMVDIKVTSIKQPQSSRPFKNARQKIFGLGYSLLLFVYDKIDNHSTRKSRLDLLHSIFIEEKRTADYQITMGIQNIIKNNGNSDDIVAFMQAHLLPVEEIQAAQIADEIVQTPPNIGYLTISNALQLRLQYRRVIEEAGKIDGICRIR